jgi:uncharacterized protein (DUF3084 family)
MASGYILIVAILVLGGVIAASGDRVGTKVGKARLTLFNLRPRQTATLVTIMTGISIAASTLGILLAADKQLRTGVFDLKRIQNKLANTRKELTDVSEQKNKVEQELVKARAEQADAQKLLNATNVSLQAVIAKQAATAKELNRTQGQLKVVSQQKEALGREIQQLQTERQELIQQRNQVREQVNELNAQVAQLNGQVNQLNAQVNQLKGQISQRDQEINKRDQIISERDRVIVQRQELEKQLKQGIAERETRLTDLKTQLQDQETQLQARQAQLQARQAQLQERDQQLQAQDKQLQEQQTKLQGLEKQQKFLAQEVASLEQYYDYYQTLRQGNVALLRGQVLAAGVVRIVDPTAARQAVDQLLSQANRNAIEATGLNKNGQSERVVQITPAQVEQLIQQIQDGRDYVVRILSAGNYVAGEKQVQVFADSVLNQVVFSAGEIVATTSANPTTMSKADIRKRIDQLVAVSQFRARRSGILGDTIQIGDGRITTLISFLEKVNEYNRPLDVQAIAAEDTYTAGPLKIRLQAMQDGKVIFSN